MKETKQKLKAGAYAVTILFLFMATAPTINAEVRQVVNINTLPLTGFMVQKIRNQIAPDQDPIPQQQTYTMSPFGLGSTMTTMTPADTSEDDEPFMPSSGRCSFMYLTAVRAEYNGSEKIVGVQFNIFMNSRNGVHVSCWEPANVCMTMEGDHAGTYYFPAWYWRETFSGPGGWWGASLGSIWDPAHDRITYFHLWADYKEDGQHIRYVDRTFTQTWESNNG